MKAQSRTAAVLASLLLSGASGPVLPLSAQLAARATYVSDGSFQLPPAGPTSPQEPIALAVGTDGSVHVADRRGLIFVFGPSGTAEGPYGRGHLGRPAAIAFDDRGTAYVLDLDPKRIQVFKSDGDWWYTIGGARRGPARLRDPLDVAVGPNGFVYVLDKSGPAIRIFGRDGAFVRGIELRPHIEDPVGLAIDGDGTILITSKKVPGSVFELPPFSDPPWGGSVSPQSIQVGASGETVSVVTDGQGTVVVLDSKDRRLWGGQRLEADAATLARPLFGGLGAGRGSFRKPVDLAFAAGRELLILDRELRKVERIRLSAQEPIPELTSDFPIHVSQLPPDIDGAVFAVMGPASGSGRFVFASEDAKSVVVRGGVVRRYTDFFGSRFRAVSLAPDSESDGFRTTLRDSPGDLAFNDTLLVIAEPKRDRFSVFDLRDGTSLGSYGSNYEDDRRLDEPRGIDLFPDGSIAVADHKNDRVAIFSADLASLLGSFFFPKVQGVAVSPSGDLFAWDETGQRVARIPFDGTPVQVLSSDVVLGPVRDMAFDPAGNLFLLEGETGRVTVVNSSRERVLVRFGGRDPEFKASHVSVDDAGNVYVASLERDSTHVYRWDVDLPDLVDVQITLTSDGATARWSPIESQFLEGYRLLASSSPGGPFEVMASTDRETVGVSARSADPIRWLRIAPMTVAGTLASGSDAIPLLHLDILSASAADEPGRVVSSMQRLDELVSEGTLRVAQELSQRLQWHAFEAEVQLGLFREAASREPALEGWTGDDGGVSLHRRLAEVHDELGNAPAVLEHATRALELLPAAARDGEAAIDLLRMAIGAAFESGAYRSVTQLGGEFLPYAGADEEYELIMRMATARLEAGQAEQALRLADEALQRDRTAGIRVYGNDRADLGWTGFRSALRLGDEQAVERWRSEVEPLVQGARLRQLHILLGGFRLQQGYGEAALDRLTSLTMLADPDVFRDSAVVDLSWGVYRALQEADSVGHAAGLVFLQQYSEGLPESLGGLRAVYADSLTVFSVREETKARLGRGFQAWRDANFVGLIQFFEDVSEGGDLTRKQDALARALLAGAYADIGNLDAAREALRAILAFDPQYDARAANDEATELYAVTPFNDSLMQLLDEVRDEGMDTA